VKSRYLIPVAVVLGAALVAPSPAAAQGSSPLTPAAAAAEPVTDPLPDPATPRLGLVVEEFASFPRSEPTPPPTDARLMRHARINHLGELPDGSERMYVPDLNGSLYLLDNDRGPWEYLDVREQVGADFFSGRGLGQGFGFVAFHPEFRRNGLFYTVHTEAGEALVTKTPDLTPQPGTVFHGVITEWRAADPAADTFSGTRREVLRLGFFSQIHGIQQIEFNPNAGRRDRDYGLLYVAAGDGGRGVVSDDPQNLAIPHGKILRIDPLGRDSANGEYGIPRSNPFVNRPGALGEIYAYGMRDPHRFSWDPAGRERLFLGHIGEKDIEAVYDVRAGDNLGWSEREGPFVFDKADRCNLYPLPADDAKYGYTYPVAAYDHDPPPGYPCTADVGHAVSGGFVYRGRRLGELHGSYLFADLVDGRLFATEEREMRRGSGELAQIRELAVFTRAGAEVTMPILAGDARVDLRFGRDAEGELYLLAKANGKVWKIVGVKRVDPSSEVHPTLRSDLTAYYDFEHPVRGNRGMEEDQGLSGTDITLINGGPAMRVRDGAYRASRRSVQIKPADPAAGRGAWKAGVYSPTGVPSLHDFNGVGGTTIMAWVKMTGDGPALNTNTPDPTDRYNAIGLAGILSGTSDGHAVRALLELIEVDGTLRLVALGRRLDAGSSQTFAAEEDWRTLLPRGEWVHLAATFDFNAGTMALYKNGRPIPGFYTVAGDPWEVDGPGPHVTSPTDPRGIKIGGSFPQDTSERNPCDCRMDSLMFLDRSVRQLEVNQQYRRVTRYGL
jgi:Glucose / Sorbosone dehydrogenase/Concanavalin A-like lectin/glucanases superfamily